MYSREDLPVVLAWHPKGSRGSRQELLFIVGCVINKIIIHGKKLLQVFSFLSNLYSMNAEGSSEAAKPLPMPCANVMSVILLWLSPFFAPI